jgi:hypothetical protein
MIANAAVAISYSGMRAWSFFVLQRWRETMKIMG